jgi:hypothetical protein
VPNQKATPQELADLATIGINAVIETQDSYAHDWMEQIHGLAWQRERVSKTVSKTVSNP